MSFHQLRDFLATLQLNNNKEWMDLHRKEYYDVRDFYIEWLEAMNDKLAAIDPNYFDTPGKKAINRINNNLMFHPTKPIYKDHFGAGLDQQSKEGDFYIEIGLNGAYIGGGYWHPSSKKLKSIREAIDYNGDDFFKILNKKSFKKMFGDMIEGVVLKTAPRGYAQDHKHIELLRRKSFAVSCSFSEKEVANSNFDDRVIEVYKEMLPFRRYLNKAVSV
ncbi:DUF2461 domain-containing protein [Ulvibacter antarcticus]|uniref:Uncharacterized protein (TIGR02453 family) n=1 Tax=Ulvibacter antarcticus TaxID=442714 RepID=A0A3L9YB85_9FLAO|nr:DUF2461 domain-containing protein [Ulvibacter antarcticus]RMA57604.1 uncharacterized protein (TIGR02453 family) [Ulvibacter antarcticus]